MKKLLKIAAIAVGVLVLLIGIGVGALFARSKRDGAGRTDNSVVVDRPAAQVYDHFTDFAKLKAWVPYFKSEQFLTEGGFRAGAKMKMTMQIDDDVTEEYEEITALEPARRIEMKLDSVEGAPIGFHEKVTWTFDESNGKTTVRVVADTTYDGAGAVMEPIITPQAQSAMDECLLLLKKNAEAEPIAATAAN